MERAHAGRSFGFGLGWGLRDCPAGLKLSGEKPECTEVQWNEIGRDGVQCVALEHPYGLE